MKLIRCACGGRARTWQAYTGEFQVQCDRCKKRGWATRTKELAQRLWNEEMEEKK